MNASFETGETKFHKSKSSDKVVGYAQLEIFHSRPVVPTRRIALGSQILDNTLVSNPSTSNSSKLTLSGLLLAAVVGRYASMIHPDLWEDLELLINNVENKKHISQPFLRFRLQTDKIGLAKTTHTLTQFADGLMDIQLPNEKSNAKGAPIQQILGALYVANSLEANARVSCISAIRVAVSWWGNNNEKLLQYLLESINGEDNAYDTGDNLNSISWALEILDIETSNLITIPSGVEVQRHFRQKLWEVHPDRGGDPNLASQLIPELAEARRVLLSANI